MRQTTPPTWAVWLAAAAIGLLSGCATRQAAGPKPNPNVVMLTPAASAPVSAGPTAAARKGLVTAPPAAPVPRTTPAATSSSPVAPVAAVSAVAAAAATPVPAVKASALPKWSLNENDKTLKVALERWSQAAGWRLLWELGVDYRIGAAATVDGNFEDAVATVMRNLDQAEVPPKAIFYRGNQVVRVVARGME